MTLFSRTHETSYLDILFTNKNKAYGSYKLRKDYNKNALKALGIVILSFTVLFLVHSQSGKVTELTSYNDNQLPIFPIEKEVEIKHVTFPKVEVPKAQQSGMLTKADVKGTYKSDIPDVVANNAVKNPIEVPPKDVSNLVASNTNSVGSNSSLAVDPSMVGDGNGSILGTDGTTVAGNTDGVTTTADNNVYKAVTQKAKPTVDINAFVSKNVIYPEIDKAAGIEGLVYISFIVELDGSVSNVIVDGKSPSPSIGRAAIDVIKKMPKWEAAVHNGKKVRSYYRYPIRFLLAR